MKKLFYAIIILQILFLVVEATTSEMELRRGRMVLLKVVPVDPRSLFMGNYLDLDYEISRIDLSQIKLPISEKQLIYDGAIDVIYVGLRPGAINSRPLSLSMHFLGNKDPNIVHLKGRGWIEPETRLPTRAEPIEALDAARIEPEKPRFPKQKPILIQKRMLIMDYGMDRYYIPESKQDEAANIFQVRNGRHPAVAAEVIVTQKGKGLIRRILVDGKPLGF